jgi:hypothetical protein
MARRAAGVKRRDSAILAFDETKSQLRLPEYRTFRNLPQGVECADRGFPVRGKCRRDTDRRRMVADSNTASHVVLAKPAD